MIGMHIAHMTKISRLLFAVSGVSGVSAAVLFFLFDIAKCWRMVSGKQTVRRREHKMCKMAARIHAREPECFPTERLGNPGAFPENQETVLLDNGRD